MIFAVISGAIYFYFFSNTSYEARGIKLISLPGNKSVELKKGEYWIWFFNKWEAHNLNSSGRIYYNTDNFKLKNVKSKSINLIAVSDDIQIGDKNKSGQLVFKVDIADPGAYFVTCSSKYKENFIAVFAPRDEHYYGLGSSMEF